MDIKRIFDHCISKAGAHLEFPFGEFPAVMKVGSRIFAELYDKKPKPQITLKCEPVLAGLLRQKYPDAVVPGYHVPDSNKPYWNTVLLDKDEIPDDELIGMIDHSYSEVLKKLSRKKRSSVLDRK